MHLTDLLSSCESGSTEITLFLELFFLGHTLLVLSLQSSYPLLYPPQSCFGIIQQLESIVQTFLGLFQGSLYGDTV